MTQVDENGAVTPASDHAERLLQQMRDGWRIIAQEPGDFGASSVYGDCREVASYLAAAKPVGDVGVRAALEPFALISSEGVVTQKEGHVTVTTCAEYFHRAAAALSRLAALPAVEGQEVEGPDRLYDRNAPMADGEIRMTAAEDVLAWLLIEKLGQPDDRGYTPSEACDAIVAALTAPQPAPDVDSAAKAEEIREELKEDADGGDPEEWMARAEAAEEREQAAMAHFRTAEAEVARLRGALEPFAAIAEEYSDAEDDDFQVWKDFDVLGATLPLSHFRRARSALSASPVTGKVEDAQENAR